MPQLKTKNKIEPSTRASRETLNEAAPMLLDACIEALEFIQRRSDGIVLDVKDTLRLAINRATKHK